MLKVSAQILWIFTNHLVNFWVQCTSQTKCSSAVYIYTYTSHETEFGLQKPQQQSSRSGVNCEWCLRATWMIFKTRGARHESLQREGAEITCGWVRNSDADQTSLPPILQTSFTTSQFAENDAAYRRLTQSLSLHSYFLPFLLIDLILIWTMVVSSSRKTSSMHHSGFELGNMKKIHQASFFGIHTGEFDWSRPGYWWMGCGVWEQGSFPQAQADSASRVPILISKSPMQCRCTGRAQNASECILLTMNDALRPAGAPPDLLQLAQKVLKQLIFDITQGVTEW